MNIPTSSATSQKSVDFHMFFTWASRGMDLEVLPFLKDLNHLLVVD
jgi:hypothetical protein